MITLTSTPKTATQTTLFDLIDDMQQKAATPLAAALIVPTVTQMIRSGQIAFVDDLKARPAA